ncbi:MAG: ASCH domain-containing protein [Candidatus Paceibacterota bacterium]|jgi:ASC-1-like (ASCH) protein
MNYNLSLNDRPFQAIKSGTKKIEGRTQKDEFDARYSEMKIGDTITFTNNISQEVMTCEILFVSKYHDVKSMLESEGTKNVLSSKGNIEEGIESYNSIGDYKDRIAKYGIYAIGIWLV